MSDDAFPRGSRPTNQNSIFNHWFPKIHVHHIRVLSWLPCEREIITRTRLLLASRQLPISVVASTRRTRSSSEGKTGKRQFVVRWKHVGKMNQYSIMLRTIHLCPLLCPLVGLEIWSDGLGAAAISSRSLGSLESTYPAFLCSGAALKGLLDLISPPWLSSVLDM